MKLTKLQRYTMYCILLQEIEEREDGICLIWYFIFREIRWGGDKMDLKYVLPELWEYRTRKLVLPLDSWFYKNGQRIAALKKCIEETHPDF